MLFLAGTVLFSTYNVDRSCCDRSGNLQIMNELTTTKVVEDTDMKIEVVELIQAMERHNTRMD